MSLEQTKKQIPFERSYTLDFSFRLLGKKGIVQAFLGPEGNLPETSGWQSLITGCSVELVGKKWNSRVVVCRQ